MIKTYLFSSQGVSEDVPFDDFRRLVAKDRALFWVDAREVTQKEIDSLARVFGLHSIALDSIIDGYRRPHLYEFSDHFYLNMTVIDGACDITCDIEPTELHIFAGEAWIVTISNEKGVAAIDNALSEYRASPNLAAHGPIYALYFVAEDLVETYFPVIDDLDDRADDLEAVMLENPSRKSLRTLFDLKHRAFELRKLLDPQRDIFNDLSRRDFPFTAGEERVYFQDIYSRMIRLFDMLDTIREILSGNLDIYLSTISNRLNSVMKTLTVLTAVIGVLAFVTGFFGMNIRDIPWLHSPHGLENVLLLMAGSSVVMLLVFKLARWL